MMKSKENGTIQRAQKLSHEEGPNWVLIFGGALLSALSVSLGFKLKQVFDAKQYDKASKGNIKLAATRLGACEVHSNLYRFDQDEATCCHCISGISGGVDIKLPENSMAKEVDASLALIKVEAADPNRKFGGVIWTSSPDQLELPSKPFHQSNSSDSPSFSESGSDIYSKREVIRKLRQQLKRRDDMILEMQTQITDLQNSLKIQMAQSANLQAQVDAANRDLFDSDREIQLLRKVIADQYTAEAVSLDKSVRNWRQENGLVKGYPDSVDDFELQCIGGYKGKVNGEKVEMLRKEIGELKEVIEGKDFLLLSYKEQKVELSSKIEELQLKLPSQAPSIL